MEELVYTSAPQGLQPGSSGFCTVEMTEGMPPEMMDSLEALSAYDNDPSQTVNWMHVQFNSMRGMRHVLSRVGPLKGEFSGRTNKLAHHICLAANELPPQGPLRIVGPGGPLRHQWSGEVRHLSPQTSPANLRVASRPRPCRTWEAAVGDAGVAGAVLSKLRSSDSEPLWVIRSPQMDALMMTDEMLALLSDQERWSLTFCTYLHTLPLSVECRLRWVLPDSPAMTQLQNIGSDQLLDLRKGVQPILKGADSQLVDAARSGKAVVGSEARQAARMPSEPPSGAARRRGVSQVDLSHLAPADPSARIPLPPPPKQQSSPLRWVILGAGLGSIPACLLLFIMMGSDPAPVAAMRELEAEQNRKPPVEVEPEAANADEKTVEPKAEDKPRPTEKKKDRKPNKNQQEPPPKVEQGPKIKSEIPISRPIALRLPTSALSLSLDRQTIHSGAGVHEVTLNRVAKVETTLEFEITEPDYAGVRDLVARAPSGEQRKMGTIYTEPDRVLLAWSPNTNRNVAAAFVLTHELLIKDAAHHNTIQFEFARPVTISNPPVARKEFEVPIPDWVLPEFEVLVKATFRSPVPDKKITFDPFAVVAPNPETKRFEKRLDLTPLRDDVVQAAKFTVWGDKVGSGTDQKIRFSSSVVLGGKGKSFEWAQRKSAIRDQAARFNEQERKKKKPAERRSMNAAKRLEVIERWGDGLRCQLELFVRVNDRAILWGKTGENAEANTGGESK